MFAERRPRTLCLACSAVAVSVLSLGACTSKAAAPPPTTVPSPVTSSTIPAATTSTMPGTTVFAPSAPQKSQTAAASRLISAWQAGDQAMAATDATPAAVTTMFSMPYPKGGVQPRGCSSAVAGPSFCDYRILTTGTLIEISVLQGPGGWYTVAVRFET